MLRPLKGGPGQSRMKQDGGWNWFAATRQMLKKKNPLRTATKSRVTRRGAREEAEPKVEVFQGHCAEAVNTKDVCHCSAAQAVSATGKSGEKTLF